MHWKLYLLLLLLPWQSCWLWLQLHTLRLLLPLPGRPRQLHLLLLPWWWCWLHLQLLLLQWLLLCLPPCDVLLRHHWCMYVWCCILDLLLLLLLCRCWVIVGLWCRQCNAGVGLLLCVGLLYVGLLLLLLLLQRLFAAVCGIAMSCMDEICELKRTITGLLVQLSFLLLPCLCMLLLLLLLQTAVLMP
jgi:hypothetical protein